MSSLHTLTQGFKNLIAKPGILEKVDALHNEARTQASEAAQRAQELRIESERLYAEAEASQGEANRLEVIARNLAEVIGLSVDEEDVAHLEPYTYPELHQ